MAPPKSMYRMIERKALYRKVVDQITKLILHNELQPGDQLAPERQLAEELGVSRNAVREAIKALQEKGLLEVKQGAGTFVQSLTSDTVSESFSLYLQTDVNRYIQLMELREIIEVEIAGRLAEHIEPADLEKLWIRIEEMRQLVDSPLEFSRKDVNFHMEFYRATKNEILIVVMQPMMDLLAEAVSASFVAPGSAERSLKGHIELVERIEAGDAQGARRVADQVIKRGKEHLKAANF